MQKQPKLDPSKITHSLFVAACTCTVYSHTVTIDFMQNTAFAVIYLHFPHYRYQPSESVSGQAVNFAEE